MYSAMRSALLGLRTSASQPTGAPPRGRARAASAVGSPVDRTRAADQARSLREGGNHDGDGRADGGSDLADEALVAPVHGELQALGGVAHCRLILRDLHRGLVETCRGEGIDVR